MTHSIAEARTEVQAATIFSRKPAEWAARMVREADGRPTGEDLEDAFREVGLCESDARIAARGLIEGRYLTFEDAVQTRLMWDTDRRNHVVSYKLTEVAARFAPKAKDLREQLAEAVRAKYPYAGRRGASTASLVDFDEARNVVRFTESSRTGLLECAFEIRDGAVVLVGTPLPRR